jgi:hypothetical protein
MEENPFDKASRYAVNMDAVGFLSWLLGLPVEQFVFRGWLNTRKIAFPGDRDHANDTVARLENVAEHGVPWALALEFQSQPDPDMFARLLGYLSGLRLALRPDEERGSRFHVGAAVVNLTGRGSAGLELRWPGTGLVTHLGVVERNLEHESAVALLTEIEAGTRSRCLLPWLALMNGGDNPAFVDRWRVAAEVEPDAHRRGEFGGLAKVFAERANRKALWDEKLEGWNMEESQVVNEWIAEAQGRTVLRAAAKRFGPAPAEVEKAIQAITDPKRIDRMIDRLINSTVTGWADLVATP